ncbi:MAG: PsbP-related protein [Candidatus Omnitrophica bacterium]|jgi:hypothetical protein|nr:PsbP-related protein [Candidatus Omnitrophota bacterium]MDD3987987.1 PsbP-related protein [Candidatus Omnitrophota bacterium]MDD4981677.1 PsbP-related protein [Candidatus Omnitrophota bacterium]MDD5664832.1 PsbP-related protein [Candidatus Omnitrophota bacterium]
MKKVIYSAIIFVFCSVSLVAAEQAQIYKSPLFDFEISYPQDWQVKEISGVIAFISPLEDADDNFSENVNIVIEDISGYQMSAEQYAKEADKNWLAADGKLKIIDFSQVMLNGEEAYCTIAENDSLKFKQYKLVNNKRAYILTYTGQPDGFSKFQDIADNIIKTFKV